MAIIYFIRHAESIVNINREFSYKLVDKGLTEKGRLQARQLAEYLTSIEFSFLFSSPMKRARETSDIIAKMKTNLSLPYQIIEEIREVNVGDLEKLPPEKMREGWKLYFEVARSWYSGNPERKFPNGENKVELVKRFNNVLKRVLKVSNGKPSVLLGHGGIFITGLTEILTNIDRKFFYENRWLNCGMSTVDVSFENGELSAQLKNFGDVSFLTGEASQQYYPLPEFED
jgi:broad specificity phosphatase PhoE